MCYLFLTQAENFGDDLTDCWQAEIIFFVMTLLIRDYYCSYSTLLQKSKLWSKVAQSEWRPLHHKSLSKRRQSLTMQFKRKWRAQWSSKKDCPLSSLYGTLACTCMNRSIREAFSVIGNWKLLPEKLFSHSFWKSSLALSLSCKVSKTWAPFDDIRARGEKFPHRAMQQNTNSATTGEKCQLQ